ncbi:MAG TPA: DoxX family protein [Gemmatimonadales bacterium]|nr:DoxX family protein [Gemmatimonadales bacterium]
MIATTQAAELPRTAAVISWIAQVVAAVILLQTLFFKFTGAPESIYIFTRLGMEPWGRYGTGTMELIASIMLLIPATAGIGAVLALGIISGAIFFHLTRLGIVVQNDGGLLFGLAVTVFLCSAVVVWLRREQIPVLRSLF